MHEKANQSLEALAKEDPVSRPLAELQLEALRAAANPVWEAAASSIPTDFPATEAPALHGQHILIDISAITALVERLTEVLNSTDVLATDQTRFEIRSIDPLVLLQSVIEWDVETLARLADEADVGFPVLMTLAHCAVLPAMLACGRRITPADEKVVWDPGYCPVCGSWPLLGEQRGLDRQLWLRCGRCSASWRGRHQRCIFCDNTDHKKLGYMAPEAERESRRAVICKECQGYFKVFSTVSPFGIADILRRDLDSIELDIAAMDSGYSRPERPGYPIEVRLFPAETPSRRWFPWQ